MQSIKQKDFNSVELTGTTKAAPDTEGLFRHAKNQVPYMWIALEGRIYVPRNGAGPNNIDVRSAQASEPFRLVLFFN